MGSFLHPYGEPDGPGGAWEAMSADERMSLLAARQHGVVSTTQLRACGLTSQAISRRLEKRRLIRLYPSVYAVGQLALAAGWREHAAVFACGPGALGSHRMAAAVCGFRRTSSARLEVTAPRGRRGPDGIIVHRSRLIQREDRAVVSGIPVTSVARTLVDLADVLTLPSLQRAINGAELLRLFDLTALDRTLARLPNRRGRGRLHAALHLYRPRAAFTRSQGERHFLRLCEEHGLPEPKANLSLAGCEVDFLWSDAGLVVEIDGAEVHRTARAFHEDRRRDRALAARGLLVVRVTALDLEDPVALAGEMKRLRETRVAGSVGRLAAA